MIAGVCAYHAIGKPGYIVLLTAITTIIVAGHGNLSVEVGLWRTLTVLIGIVIALRFSFVLPQYVTYSWRYRLAGNMRESAQIYGAIMERRPMFADTLTKHFLTMNARLVSSRSLLASVAKEINVPAAVLDDIQRQHCLLLTALEMMAAAMPAGAPGFTGSAHTDERAVRHTLLLIARALRFRVGLLYAATRSAAAAARLEQTANVARALHLTCRERTGSRNGWRNRSTDCACG